MSPSRTLQNLYLSFLNRETPRQTGMLFSAQTASLFAGLFATVILGRWMTPDEYGRFAFCLSLLVITSVCFEFGVTSAGARVLALALDRDSERRALGALVLMTLATGIVFSVTIVAAAAAVDAIFKTDVRWLLVTTAALAFFLPFQLLIEQSCQGLNRIRLLSLFQLLMSGSYLLGLIILVAAHRLNAGTALGAYLAGEALAAVWTLARLRPTFTGASQYIKMTLGETRGYGFNLYLARISGLASLRADHLVIRYFLTDAALGTYAIAQKLTNPLAMMSRALGVTRFRAFARINRVPGRITRWNAVVLLAASVGVVVLGPIALRLIFPRFASAAPLLIPFAAMNLFVGLLQPYNSFLASHGRGAELRNIVLLVGLASVGVLTITVPRYGTTGAAWTVAAAMALDYVLHLYYYRKVTRQLDAAGESSAGISSTAAR